MRKKERVRIREKDTGRGAKKRNLLYTSQMCWAMFNVQSATHPFTHMALPAASLWFALRALRSRCLGTLSVCTDSVANAHSAIFKDLEPHLCEE